VVSFIQGLDSNLVITLCAIIFIVCLFLVFLRSKSIKQNIKNNRGVISNGDVAGDITVTNTQHAAEPEKKPLTWSTMISLIIAFLALVLAGITFYLEYL